MSQTSNHLCRFTPDRRSKYRIRELRIQNSILLSSLLSLFGYAFHGVAADTSSNVDGAATSPQVTTVFKSGAGEINRYRIPGMVVTKSGAVLAYCEARRNSSSDWGEIEIHLRRSEDQGKSWSDSVKIAHRGERMEGNPEKPIEGKTEQTVNNPVAVVDASTGHVHFIYCVNYARCFWMLSQDDGVSWSAPVDITAAFEPLRSQYPWTVIATGPGHGVQMKSGRLVIPIWLAYGQGGAHRPSASGTLFSDDQGKTWKVGDIAFPNEPTMRNPNETIAAVLRDGRLLLINRNESTQNRKLISWSDDGATQWSRPQFVEDLWEPICMSSVVQYPGTEGPLVYSGVRSLPVDSNGEPLPGRSAKRHRLSLQLSTDQGLNWPVIRELDAGPSAYSDLAIATDGEILCLFESGVDIRLAKISLDWIREGTK